MEREDKTNINSSIKVKYYKWSDHFDFDKKVFMLQQVREACFSCMSEETKDDLFGPKHLEQDTVMLDIAKRMIYDKRANLSPKSKEYIISKYGS